MLAFRIQLNEIEDMTSFIDDVSSVGHVEIYASDNKTIHCLSPAEYNLLKNAEAKAKLLSRILIAEDEIESSQHIKADVLFLDEKTRLASM